MKSAINVGELKKALEKLEKLTNATEFSFELDHLGRVKISGSDLAGRLIAITLFDSATQKMAEITYTERL